MFMYMYYIVKYNSFLVFQLLSPPPPPQSELSDVSPNEEFTTSLGADQSIRITCRPVGSVHGNTGVLTKNKIITYTHTFVVKNTRADSVNIQVSEQVPLTTDDRIKVSWWGFNSVQHWYMYYCMGIRLIGSLLSHHAFIRVTSLLLLVWY